MSTLSYPSSLARAVKGADVALVLIPESRVPDGWLETALDVPWRGLLAKAAEAEEAGRTGRAVGSVNPFEGPDRVVLGLLPDRVSRHNSPSRSEFVPALAAAAGLNGKHAAVVVCLEEAEHFPAIARAVARTLPLFSQQSAKPVEGGKGRRRGARTALLGLGLDGSPIPLPRAEKILVERSRWAAKLVDTPTAQLTTTAFEKAVRKAVRGLAHVKVRSIVGKELLEQRLGGIHAVGRTAQAAPRLLLVRYSPPKSRRTVGIVGKGVVYDTGGLSLKSSTGMSGMKCDMGGAAAAVAATLALAEAGAKEAVVCALPLAENAIGPSAYRPDDILTMHSGKTVEINNTDAEGRLLLGDAVSYVGRKHKPAAILDAATLTGAQAIATGLRHAAVVSNREGLERLAIRVGRTSGDLVAPLPFAPEFYQDEFKSKVADMKNSVANRRNAQTSCAAQFVYSHIEDLDIPWLHVDLAGPAFRDDRGTGFGVALLANVTRAIDADALAD